MATVVAVDWGAPDGATTWIEYGLDDDFDLSTPTLAASSGVGSLALMGLKAGRDYQVRSVWLDEDGARQQSDPVAHSAPMYPQGIVSVAVTAKLGDQVQPGGFILLPLMQTDRTWVLLLDRQGELVWWYDVGEALLAPSVRMSRDGHDLLMGVYDRDQEEDIGEIRRVSLRTGDVRTTRTELGHHDFLELPDGRLAWLAYDKRQVDYGGELIEVVGDEIVIGEEGRVEGDPVESLFRFHDEYAPALVCYHQDLEVLGLGGKDWTHSNSLAYVDDTDEIVVVARHMDTILALDAQTGQRSWQFGGSGGMAGEPMPAIDHGHLSDVWDGGLLVFDNGDHRSDQHSRVIEYSFDAGSQTYRVAWEYDHPQKLHVQILGDARRLPNGNKLVSWASLGTLTELSADGQELWTLQSDLGAIYGRVRWIDDLYAPTRGL